MGDDRTRPSLCKIKLVKKGTDEHSPFQSHLVDVVP